MTDSCQTIFSSSLFDDHLLSFNPYSFDGTGPFLSSLFLDDLGCRAASVYLIPHLSGTVSAVDQLSFHELLTSTPCDECVSRNAGHPLLFRIPTRRKGSCRRESIIARDFFQPELITGGGVHYVTLHSPYSSSRFSPRSSSPLSFSASSR